MCIRVTIKEIGSLMASHASAAPTVQNLRTVLIQQQNCFYEIIKTGPKNENEIVNINTNSVWRQKIKKISGIYRCAE